VIAVNDHGIFILFFHFYFIVFGVRLFRKKRITVDGSTKLLAICRAIVSSSPPQRLSQPAGASDVDRKKFFTPTHPPWAVPINKIIRNDK
jgi:hypothetical protein